MTRFAMVLCVMAFVLCGGVTAQSPRNPAPDSSWERTTEIIRRSIERTDNLETFGKDIVREIMTRAISIPRGDAPGPITIDIAFEVGIIEIPEVPSPDQIDICWEICPTPQGGSFIQCYVDCSGPGIDVGHIIVRTCDDIRRDMAGTTNLWEKMKYVRELIQKGCLEAKEVKLEIPLKR